MARTPVVEKRLLDALRERGTTTLDLTSDRDWLEEITPDPDALLHRLRRKGIAHRLQYGRHQLNLDAGSSRQARIRTLDDLAPLLLRRLDMPYIVSWHSALWRHGLIDQQSQRLYVAVLGRKRDARVGRLSVHFVTVAPRKFFGWDKSISEHSHLRVASVEKALVDSLDQPDLAAGMAMVVGALQNAWTTDKLDPAKLLETALAFDSPTLNRRLGYLMDSLEIPGSDPLVLRLGRSYAVTLEPGIMPEVAAGVNPKWRIYENQQLILAARSPK